MNLPCLAPAIGIALPQDHPDARTRRDEPGSSMFVRDQRGRRTDALACRLRVLRERRDTVRPSRRAARMRRGVIREQTDESARATDRRPATSRPARKEDPRHPGTMPADAVCRFASPRLRGGAAAGGSVFPSNGTMSFGGPSRLLEELANRRAKFAGRGGVQGRARGREGSMRFDVCPGIQHGGRQDARQENCEEAQGAAGGVPRTPFPGGGFNAGIRFPPVGSSHCISR